MPKATTTEAPAVSDRDQRLAYFDRADQYTPYLATARRRGAVPRQDRGQAHRALAVLEAGAEGSWRRSTGRSPRSRASSARTRSRGRSFVDVGANIGTTTIPALLSHGFETAVAIEPEPENVRVLRMNVLLNDLEDRVDGAARGRLERGRPVRAGRRPLARRQALDRDRPQQAQAEEPGRERDAERSRPVTLDHLVEPE